VVLVVRCCTRIARNPVILGGRRRERACSTRILSTYVVARRRSTTLDPFFALDPSSALVPSFAPDPSRALNQPFALDPLDSIHSLDRAKTDFLGLSM
jgi:hypothetical protein